MKPYKLPASYRLGGPGCGCFLEPPSHPRYFVQPVYTAGGNSPGRGPSYFLDGMGADQLEDVDELYGAAKYPRLPLDHPRTRAWVLTLHAYLRTSYRPAWAPLEHGKPGTILYPVPGWDIKSAAAVRERGAPGPEDHSAVVFVRKHYPEYAPEPALISEPPPWGAGGGDWWETEAERPAPDNCRPRSMGQHPLNGSWCQWCGWSAGEPVAAPAGGAR